MQGFVYVWGGEGIYKIGKAKNPQSRIQQFPVMPYPCDFAHILPSTTASVLERYLHFYFTSKKLRGEWFQLAEEDLITIPQLAIDAPTSFEALQTLKDETILSENVNALRTQSGYSLDIKGLIQPTFNKRFNSQEWEFRWDISLYLTNFLEAVGHKYSFADIEYYADLTPGLLQKWCEYDAVADSTSLRRLRIFTTDRYFGPEQRDNFKEIPSFATRIACKIDNPTRGGVPVTYVNKRLPSNSK